MDRPTGQVIRRIHTTGPASSSTSTSRSWDGSHPAAVGVRMDAATSIAARPHHGSATTSSTPAIDAHSRLAYSEVLSNETRPRPAAAFWQHTAQLVHRAMASPSSGPNRQRPATTSATTSTTRSVPSEHHHGSGHTDPQTNGKVERFNRTLVDEWAYARVYRSRRTAPGHLTVGSTSTTITAATPPSEAATHHPRNNLAGNTSRARTRDRRGAWNGRSRPRGRSLPRRRDPTSVQARASRPSTR